MTWDLFLVLLVLLRSQEITMAKIDFQHNLSVIEGGNAQFPGLSGPPSEYILLWSYKKFSNDGDPYYTRIGICRFGSCKKEGNFRNYTEISVDSANYNLIITGVRRRNDGIYQKEVFDSSPSGSTKSYGRLIVLVPPGSPEIALNSSAPLVDESVKLTCTSTGGNPAPSLTWRWLRPDGTPRPDISPQISRPEKVFGTISSTIITRMSMRDHLSTIQCGVHNSAGNVTSSVLKLEINKLPGRTTITKNVDKPRENEFVELKCSSEGGNPKPNITWTWTRMDGSIRDVSGETITEPDRPFGKITSTLRVKLNYNDDRSTLKCSARNRVGDSGTAAMVLDVIYKPRMESFLYSPYSILEGEPLNVKCRVRGNPMPRVTWEKDGVQVVDGDTLSYASLSKTNSGDYTCTASNIAGTTQLRLQLRVIFPPSVQMHTQKSVHEGDQLTIRCQVHANPPARVHWIRPNGNRVDIDGPEFKIDSISRSQKGSYQCVAQNELKPSVGEVVRAEARGKTLVIVKYRPGAPTSSANPSSSVEVNTNVKLECNPNDKDPGVPSPELIWTKNNLQLSKNGTYHIIRAQLSDSGRYRCTPKNDVGEGVFREIEVQIEEAPKFVDKLNSNTTMVMHNRDQDFSIFCTVTGKPMPRITWYRDSAPITGTGDLAFLFKVTASEQPIRGDTDLGFRVKSVLSFRGEKRLGDRLTSLRADDNGNYSCRASNSRGKILSEMKLIVQYPPQFSDPKYVVAADLKSGSVKIRCPVTSQPPPIVTEWFLPDGRKVTDSAVDARFSVHENPEPTLRIYTSILTITGLSKDDLKLYRCKTRNLLGNNTLNVELRNQSKPETPKDFKVVSKTWESAFLSWKAGFNGGFPQSFLIIVEWNNRDERKENIIRENFNLTNLLPNTSYSLRIAATNDLGTGLYSSRALFETDTLFIPRIQDIYLELSTKRLRFTAPPGYCVRVDVSSDNGQTWMPFRDCLTPSENSELVSSINQDYRAALCLPRRRDVCSEFKLAHSDASPEVSLVVILIVAIACAVLIVLLFGILIFFCIRRRPRRKNFEENVAHRRPQAVTINPYAPTPPSTGPALHQPPMKPFALVTPTSGAVHPPNAPAYENGAAYFGQDDGECGRSSRGRASPWDGEKRTKTSTFGDSVSVLTPHSNSSQDPLHLSSPRSMTISRSALSSPIPNATLQLGSGTCPRQPKKVIYEVVV